MNKFAIDDIVYELNDRASGYCKNGMGIEFAIEQAVKDWAPYLRGVGYRILSLEEIQLNGSTKFFESYGDGLL